jgi:hypothetical protein
MAWSIAVSDISSKVMITLLVAGFILLIDIVLFLMVGEIFVFV